MIFDVCKEGIRFYIIMSVDRGEKRIDLSVSVVFKSAKGINYTIYKYSDDDL